MYTRFAKVLLALGLADVGYLNMALGPELFPRIADERTSTEPSTARAALREGEPHRARPEQRAPSDLDVAPTASAPAADEAPAEAAAAGNAEPAVDSPTPNDTPTPTDATPPAEGEVVVRFPETAATALTDDARAELHTLAEQLREHPDQRLRIVGHADARGSRGFNRYLGARRARAVTEALLAAGVARKQIQAVSRGEDDPRVTGEDEAAWAENRRVEIRIDSERSNTP